MNQLHKNNKQHKMPTHDVDSNFVSSSFEKFSTGFISSITRSENQRNSSKLYRQRLKIKKASLKMGSERKYEKIVCGQWKEFFFGKIKINRCLATITVPL